MEFVTLAQRACYEKVVPWLKELFGSYAMVRNDIPVIQVTIGSALATVRISPWGEDDATISSRAYVVTGVELSADLMHFLLRENDKMRFGAFGVDGDENIFFEHTIVGSSVDKDELKGSVMAVVITADQYDDQIVTQWGGQRALQEPL